MLTYKRAEEDLVPQLLARNLDGEGFERSLEKIERAVGQPHEAVLTVTAHGGADSAHRTALLGFAREREDALHDFGVIVDIDQQLDKLTIVFH